MPHMMPMLWLFIFMLSFSMLFLLSFMMYFFYIPKIPHIKSKNYKLYKWIWMW